MTTELTLIRHGQAVRFDGDYVKAPLTALGRQQATLTGQHFCLERQHFHGFYCSPLRRARETAALIGAQAGQIPHRQSGLQEMVFLELPPLVLLESLARLGAFRKYLERNAGKPLRWPLMGRVSQVLTQLIARHSGQHIALVTHGGVISATLVWYFPRDRRRWWHGEVDNCSLTRLEVTGTTAKLMVLNDIRHLQPLLASALPPAGPVERARNVEQDTPAFAPKAKGGSEPLAGSPH
jgi:probable phosphoglycerate mutase